MAKKKKKIAKLNDEQYVAYITGLKEVEKRQNGAQGVSGISFTPQKEEKRG